MSLANYEVGGYDLLSALEDDTVADKAPAVSAAAAPPRFGRRAAPTSLDQEALSRDASRRPSTMNMPSVHSVNASQDRRDGTTGRRGTKRPVGSSTTETGSKATGEDLAHSVNTSSADVKLPQIRSSQSREGSRNGVPNGRRSVGDNNGAVRHSVTSPSANGQVRRGLFDTNGTAAAQPPQRPQSTMESAPTEADETFLDDRVSVAKGSFTGTRAGWVREQARRLEEQVAAAQALANSPHSLSSIRQRSANNSSWRQRMEGSMSMTSPDNRGEETNRRQSSAPADNAATTSSAAQLPQRSSAPVVGTTTTTTSRQSTATAAMRRNLAPISPTPTATSTKAADPKTAANAKTSSSNNNNEYGHFRGGDADNTSQRTQTLTRGAVPDSILSAEYGHALGTMDWNHEYDISDLTELFPSAQSLQSKFAIAPKPGKKKITPTVATKPVAAPPSRTATSGAPLRQQTGPVRSPAKSGAPSAPSSDSLAGITSTNASTGSRLAASVDKNGSSRLAGTTPTPVVSPGAKSAEKPTDGSLYTAAQRAKLEAWQSIPILSYRPAEAERYVADCNKYFPAKKPATAGNLFSFPVAGRAPPEMAGEAVEMNYEIHNVLTLLRHRHRKPMWTYPAVMPIELPAQTRQRRPRTPRSFYGPEMPEKGNDWFRGVLDDATRVPSPDLTEIEAKEAEEKKRNPKALKGVSPEVAVAHRERKELDNVDEINKAAIPIQA